MSGRLGDAAVCLLIGLLLGLERERSQRGNERLFAGIRTFPLLVIGGYLGALIGEGGAPLVLPAVVLAIAGIAIAAYWRSAEEHAGATTEVLAVLAPLLGAAVGLGHQTLSAALAVGMTLLLTLKAPLHRIAGAVSEEEIFAIVKFAIVAVVLLPLLPDRGYGPFQAIVPRHVGLVVVIVSAVSLVGYLLVRILGGKTGWALTGLLGGLASSTAVTLSLSAKARSGEASVRALAAGIVLASVVLYARTAVLIALFDVSLLEHLWPRLLALLVVGVVFAVAQLRAEEQAAADPVKLHNPVELGKAFGLGLLFALIVVFGRWAQLTFGSAGLWASGAVGGLLDVDSVTLANARLHHEGLASAEQAGGALLLATLTNLALKGTVVVTTGGKELARRVLPAFVALAAATALALVV